MVIKGSQCGVLTGDECEDGQNALRNYRWAPGPAVRDECVPTVDIQRRSVT